MTTQPNKPGGQIDADGQARAVEDRQSVKTQSEVTPDDYPKADRDTANPARR